MYVAHLMKDVAEVDPDDHLGPEEEDRLHRHHGGEAPPQGQQQPEPGQNPAGAKSWNPVDR